jgi:hypothetical protein
MFALVSVAVFAGGEMDMSAIKKTDIAKLEKIVDALEPIYAIETALKQYPKESYPVGTHLKVQKMKINMVFNEYGFEYNSYTTYTAEDKNLNILLAKLKSRYSYLDSLDLSRKETLEAALKELKE